MDLAALLAALALAAPAAAPAAKPAPAAAAPPAAAAAEGWGPKVIAQFALRTRAKQYQSRPVTDPPQVAAVAACLAASTRSEREDVAGATHYLDVLGRTPRAGRWALHAAQGWFMPLGVARPPVFQLDERCRAEVLGPLLPR